MYISSFSLVEVSKATMKHYKNMTAWCTA